MFMPGIESPNNPERHEQTPSPDVPYMGGGSPFRYFHSESNAIHAMMGDGEITNPATAEDMGIQTAPTERQPADTNPADVAHSVGELSIRQTPQPAIVRLQTLRPTERPPEVSSENAWLPPDETLTAEATDSMFDVLASSDAITEEQTQRAATLYQTGVLEWMGDYDNPPALETLFGPNEADLTDEKQLSQLLTKQVVDTQLRNLVDTLGGIEDGMSALDVLRLTSFRDATRPVIEHRDVIEVYAGEGYRAGQFAIQADEDGITVREQPVPQAARRPANLMAYSPNKHEVRLVNANAQERYRITGTDDQPRVIHDTLHSLGTEDAEFFAALITMISGHKRLLVQVASDAGVDPVTQFNVTAGTVNRDAATREEVNDKVGKLMSANGPAPSLRSELEASANIIYEMIRTKRNLNTDSRTVEQSGLRTVGARMRAYYNVILPRSNGSL